MARRRRVRRRVKRKHITITEQYNRYATGLEYFGESFETKKRATSKGLKELKTPQHSFLGLRISIR